MTQEQITASSNATETVTTCTFTLKARNNSSLSSGQYFSVFPSYLKTPPPKEQILLALISEATENSAEKSDTTLTWSAGLGAMTMFAMLRDGDPEKADKTAAVLGDIVSVNCTDGSFTLAAAAGGAESVITVNFSGDIPTGSYIGLQAGPAPILLVIPADKSALTLTPASFLSATVIFGTAYKWPKPGTYDESQPLIVNFTQDSAQTATASIAIGPDDLLVQIS